MLSFVLTTNNPGGTKAQTGEAGHKVNDLMEFLVIIRSLYCFISAISRQLVPFFDHVFVTHVHT